MMDPSETPVIDSSGFSYLSVQALFPKASQRAEIDWKVSSVPCLATVSTSFLVNYAASAILLPCSGSYSFLAVSSNLSLQSLHPFPCQVHQPLIFPYGLHLIHRSPRLEPQSTLPLQGKGFVHPNMHPWRRKRYLEHIHEDINRSILVR